MNNIIPFCQPWILPEEADAVREQVASGWIGPGSASVTAIGREALERFGCL